MKRGFGNNKKKRLTETSISGRFLITRRPLRIFVRRLLQGVRLADHGPVFENLAMVFSWLIADKPACEMAHLMGEGVPYAFWGEGTYAIPGVSGHT